MQKKRQSNDWGRVLRALLPTRDTQGLPGMFLLFPFMMCLVLLFCMPCGESMGLVSFFSNLDNIWNYVRGAEGKLCAVWVWMAIPVPLFFLHLYVRVRRRFAEYGHIKSDDEKGERFRDALLKPAPVDAASAKPERSTREKRLHDEAVRRLDLQQIFLRVMAKLEVLTPPVIVTNCPVLLKLQPCFHVSVSIDIVPLPGPGTGAGLDSDLGRLATGLCKQVLWCIDVSEWDASGRAKARISEGEDVRIAMLAQRAADTTSDDNFLFFTPSRDIHGVPAVILEFNPVATNTTSVDPIVMTKLLDFVLGRRPGDTVRSRAQRTV